ncbi:MAG: hypothetical protein L0Z62_12910 [Gemmataceae bacterium]|nr:hypothetical protein [Gemmataceae bacterium]
MAEADELAAAYRRALACDPVSAYGGIIAVNQPLDAATVAAIGKLFVEVIIAPAVTAEARGLLADLRVGQAQQADGRVLHHLRLGADGDGEHAGHVDSNVLNRQGALEGNLDLERLQGQVGVVLDQRHHEGGPAVDALGGLLAADLAEDDQDAVAGAALVALDEQQEEAEQDQRHRDDDQRGRQPAARGGGGDGRPAGLGEERGARHGQSSRYGLRKRPPGCRD